MNPDDHLLTLLEALRIPLSSPSSPLDWKDWYHFVLFDMTGGCRILANVSLAGRPGYGHVTCTGILTVPGRGSPAGLAGGSYGFCADFDWLGGMVMPYPVTVAAAGTSLRIDTRTSRLTMRDDRSCFELAIGGTAQATPVLVPEASPFGSGFIGWGFVPGIAAAGYCSVGRARLDISPRTWFCYHDHNYGRFRWGQDVGWIWFVAHFTSARGEPMTCVLHRGNHHDETKIGAPYLFVYRGAELVKVFTGDAVSLEWSWDREERRPVRLPGIMASLFSDRTVRMPAGLLVAAADDADSVRIRFRVTDALELVLPDTQERQYTFIEELNGTASVSCTLNHATTAARGYFYAEYVF